MYYDTAENVWSVAGHRIKARSPSSYQCMKTLLNAKTPEKFTYEQKWAIDHLQSHNLLRNTAACCKSISSLSLLISPDTVASCCLKKLKAMVIVRSGSVTSRNGKAIPKHGDAKHDDTKHDDDNNDTPGPFGPKGLGPRA